MSVSSQNDDSDAGEIDLVGFRAGGSTLFEKDGFITVFDLCARNAGLDITAKELLVGRDIGALIDEHLYFLSDDEISFLGASFEKGEKDVWVCWICWNDEYLRLFLANFSSGYFGRPMEDEVSGCFIVRDAKFEGVPKVEDNFFNSRDCWISSDCDECIELDCCASSSFSENKMVNRLKY